MEETLAGHHDASREGDHSAFVDNRLGVQLFGGMSKLVLLT